MDALVNENIMAPEVLVINEKGEQVGVKRIEEARKLAKSVELDLVCVAPNANPPVCRFLDYSKFRYEQQKRARESKKNQKMVTVKEIWLTPVISVNDFETKLRTGRKFLQDGDKLKVTLRFNRRVRMLSSDIDSQKNLDKFVEMTQDIATVESKPSLEGKSISLILVPKKK
ncbi:MAG TPA: translation initiation factor IF-3 [Bacilli bacterium]|mgnify:FL=1|nr:MAG: Translation initiation factor IF-3 [Tenericutes bacterium ADurb.BinA124]HPX84852.1 translation initiation factor IF-3 [Bacilli bacterium]